jgi:hypothetical protein
VWGSRGARSWLVALYVLAGFALGDSQLGVPHSTRPRIRQRVALIVILFRDGLEARANCCSRPASAAAHLIVAMPLTGRSSR